MNDEKTRWRYQAIKPILDEKKTITEVAQSLAISRATIYRWLKRYRNRGVSGLRHKSHKAHNKTCNRITQLICDLRREKLFRSSGEIAKEINEKYKEVLQTSEHKESISRQTVWRVLKEHGFNGYKFRRSVMKPGA